MPDDALKPDAALYEQDFALWAEAQARALMERRARDLDWANLAEEIESLGGSQKSEILSRLTVLILHLMKWERQPRKRKYGWRSSIIEQRTAIRILLDASPSLRRYPPMVFERAHLLARRRAVEETGLHEREFPAQPPYALEDVLRDGFYPGAPGGPA